jgi:hypothetical protein
LWRPSNGTWLWLSASTNFDPAAGGGKVWGVSGDKPLKGDIDGDGKPDLIVWRPSTGTFYWLTSSTGYNLANQGMKQWGASSDVPFLGDVDGDGKVDLIVWRPSTGVWFWLTSSTGYNYANQMSKAWGNQGLGDVPMLADFDGDRRVDLTVWRASTGMWYWLTSGSGYDYAAQRGAQWGNQSLGDQPFLADMDADGKSDLVVWRASTGTWYWITSTYGYDPHMAWSAQWGSQGMADVPMLSDLDGDGRAELIVWRPFSGTYFWLTSASGYSYNAQKQREWGTFGDIPIRK